MNITRSLCIGAPLSGEPHPVLQWVEIASFLQIPHFQIIGLPGPEVAEARERVRAAIEASGLEFPRRRVVLNLAPSSIKKRGTGVDLAMALAVLHDSYGLAPLASGSSVVAWGELGLDGTLKPAYQLTRAVYAAWEAGADLLIVAHEEYEGACERARWIREAGQLMGAAPGIARASSLMEAWDILRDRKNWDQWKVLGSSGIAEPAGQAGESSEASLQRDSMALLPLSKTMERVIGVAATGAHHLMLLGPRGTGKSHALEWLVALQPPLNPQVRVKQALLQELGGPAWNRGTESATPNGGEGLPIRRVSPQARPAALLGGANGAAVRPGEFSLAHGGLLIADEFPEWQRDSREALREPLERGVITLTRAQRTVELPARFILAANGNLCPCGGWPQELPLPTEAQGRRISRCQCSMGVRTQYLSRLSGPILDRMDLVVMIAGVGAGVGSLDTSTEPAPQWKPKKPKLAEAVATGLPSLPSSSPSPTSATAPDRLRSLRAQTRIARELAIRSWGKPPGRLEAHELEALLAARPEWQDQLNPALFASLRTRHKILRVALTLAAWDGHAEPLKGHFMEATYYRAERFGLAR
jgi:magnesium chelatase family protein